MLLVSEHFAGHFLSLLAKEIRRDMLLFSSHFLGVAFSEQLQSITLDY
jgi:hypothetical protein